MSSSAAASSCTPATAAPATAAALDNDFIIQHSQDLPASFTGLVQTVLNAQEKCTILDLGSSFRGSCDCFALANDRVVVTAVDVCFDPELRVQPEWQSQQMPCDDLPPCAGQNLVLIGSTIQDYVRQHVGRCTFDIVILQNVYSTRNDPPVSFLDLHLLTNRYVLFGCYSALTSGILFGRRFLGRSRSGFYDPIAVYKGAMKLLRKLVMSRCYLLHDIDGWAFEKSEYGPDVLLDVVF